MSNTGQPAQGQKRVGKPKPNTTANKNNVRKIPAQQGSMPARQPKKAQPGPAPGVPGTTNKGKEKDKTYQPEASAQSVRTQAVPLAGNDNPPRAMPPTVEMPSNQGNSKKGGRAPRQAQSAAILAGQLVDELAKTKGNSDARNSDSKLLQELLSKEQLEAFYADASLRGAQQELAREEKTLDNKNACEDLEVRKLVAEQLKADRLELVRLKAEIALQVERSKALTQGTDAARECAESSAKMEAVQYARRSALASSKVDSIMAEARLLDTEVSKLRPTNSVATELWSNKRCTFTQPLEVTLSSYVCDTILDFGVKAAESVNSVGDAVLAGVVDGCALTAGLFGSFDNIRSNIQEVRMYGDAMRQWTSGLTALPVGVLIESHHAFGRQFPKVGTCPRPEEPEIFEMDASAIFAKLLCRDRITPEGVFQTFDHHKELKDFEAFVGLDSFKICDIPVTNYRPSFEPLVEFGSDLGLVATAVAGSASRLLATGILSGPVLSAGASVLSLSMGNTARKTWNRTVEYLSDLVSAELRCFASRSAKITGDNRPMLDRTVVAADDTYVEYTTFALLHFRDGSFRIRTDPREFGLDHWIENPSATGQIPVCISGPTVDTVLLGNLPVTFRSMVTSSSLFQEIVNRKSLAVSSKMQQVERAYRMAEASDAHQELIHNLQRTGHSVYQDTLRLTTAMLTNHCGDPKDF